MNNNQVSKMDALNRALIGFDTMFDHLERRYSNSAPTNYPPHNQIKTGDNEYLIQLAVTGFSKAEVRIEVEGNILTVHGESQATDYAPDAYLYRGLATRDFVKEFPLAEHIEVRGAWMENGMLNIKLVRNIPESAKPKIIDIVEVK
jgi:molecular chaperone IbpA